MPEINLKKNILVGWKFPADYNGFFLLLQFNYSSLLGCGIKRRIKLSYYHWRFFVDGFRSGNLS